MIKFVGNVCLLIVTFFFMSQCILPGLWNVITH